jgi:methionyl-tRNA synthetase
MNHTRPFHPKKAIVTAGMPYGDKELHFGHIGGVFVQADIYTRFLRDRIGSENVIFISGTDCFGSAIETGYEKAVANGFQGDLTDFVNENYLKQKETLDDYQISLDLYGASALGETGRIHSAFSQDIFMCLYKRGVLKLEETIQFYDEEKDVFLNGRQVCGRCPIQGCKSEKAYADECSLGHQYKADELINPISVISGNKPTRVTVKNWFFDLPLFEDQLNRVVNEWEKNPSYRKDLIVIMREFLKKPSVYVKKELIDEISNMKDMPCFHVVEDEKKSSWELVFENLFYRDRAVSVLSKNKVRYRTGKTLVPFRLSGNVNWGIPVPEMEGVDGLTFWVWPESLWAPISFIKAYLNDGLDGREWEKWLKSDETQVYQFIGEDNIYFYGIAQTGLLLALDEVIKLPIIIPNHHLLYGKKKASSSSEIKPPKAAKLLDYYTSDQLRMHFMNASLGERSVGFEPKALLEKNEGFDTVLYEGNLVCNIFNRLVRSCFYTIQKYNDGIYPERTNNSKIQ